LRNYRCKLDVIGDILQVVSQGAKKTRIMYQANLNYAGLTKYLREVSKASLINYDQEKQWYILTSKGEEFLEAYEKYSRASKHINKLLKKLDCKKKVLENLCSSK
jgi:predicted transcriptional regulator